MHVRVHVHVPRCWARSSDPNPNPNQVLGAELEWVRELLRYCTGRATLRAYDSPAHYFEDDKDGVKVREYTMVHMHTCVRACA